MIKISPQKTKSIFSTTLLTTTIVLGTLNFSSFANVGSDIIVKSIKTDLSNPVGNETFWKNVKPFTANLMSQPMAIPQSKVTQTQNVNVQAVHNGKWITFKLTWKDSEKSEAGPLGKFSDGVAIEFPASKITGGAIPPSAFMGEKGKPVHIYHWKSAFQYDKDHGKMKTVKEIYPNASIDLYPLEPKKENREPMKNVVENYPKATESQKMVFVHGQAAGNPQSFPKLKALDEIYAEGWGTSQVIDNHEGIGNGKWENGNWTVVISRPLKSKVGSVLEVGKDNFVCFAVWQGGKGEVGSRKSVTLAWIPLKISK
ncbi:MAG: ethylbenzene dehydrogenase-related protein [Candidatus Sericytochromatia bacterium]